MNYELNKIINIEIKFLNKNKMNWNKFIIKNKMNKNKMNENKNVLINKTFLILNEFKFEYDIIEI